MSTETANSLIGRAIAGGGAGGVAAAPAAAVPPGGPVGAGALVSFMLRLNDGVARSAAERLRAQQRGEIPVLQPGRTYRFAVQPGAPDRPGVPAVPLAAGAALLLAYEGAPPLELDIAEHVLAAATPAAATHEFALALPEACAASDGELRLYYARSEVDELELVATLPVHVVGEGGLRAEDEILLQAAGLAPMKPPPELAILHITRDATPGLVRASGGAYDAAGIWRQREGIVLKAPPGNLAELVDRDTDPDAIVEAMMRYGRGLGELQKWLNGLLTGTPAAKRVLLICDQTFAAMPWEMLFVRTDEGEAPLGAVLDVARWMPLDDYGESLPLRLTGETHSGDALAYVDERGLTDAAAEITTLAELGLERSRTLSGVVQRLRQRPPDLGLLYLACHGDFASGEVDLHAVVDHQIRLGSVEDLEHGVTALELERVPRFTGRRPLLFVNACHSARLSADGEYGLPNVLLARVGTAYLGTLGFVGSEYASKVARRFLAAAAGNDGVIPARLLRELRAEAAAPIVDVAGEPTPRDWATYVFAFTYVFYGDPLARFRLRTAADAAGGATDGEDDG